MPEIIVVHNGLRKPDELEDLLIKKLQKLREPPDPIPYSDAPWEMLCNETNKYIVQQE